MNKKVTSRGGTVRSVALLAWLFLSLILVAAPSTAQQRPVGPVIPSNMDSALRHLVLHYHSGQPLSLNHETLAIDGRTGKPVHAVTAKPLFFSDTSNRILVDILLKPKTKLDSAKKDLAALGLNVIAASDRFGLSMIDAFLPISSAETVARLPEVRSLKVAYRPRTNVGLVTSQGATVLRTDVANSLGFTGKGITVGISSDSFNTSQFAGQPDTAAVDVATGDLPNTTAIPGCEGLVFCADLVPVSMFGIGTDEGRGMAQIVHDLAPDANLCFGTAFISELQFALNILAMADPMQSCKADVIVDDVIYFDEPMFSDGILAQAADFVASNGVSYFSSAGNQAGGGYNGHLNIVPDATARGLGGQSVDLSSIPPVDPVSMLAIDTSGGFQNFNPEGSAVILSQFMEVGDLTIFSVQWDDPFGTGPITTDLDMQFFDGDPSSATFGKWLFTVNTDNFALGAPIELFQLTSSNGMGGGPPLLLQLVVSRKGTIPMSGLPAANLSQRLRYVTFGALLAQFSDRSTRTTFGHNSAASSNGVAAYQYSSDPAFVYTIPGTRGGGFRPELESFSSPGPVEILLDTMGNRLGSPELRLKPDIAAVDGVDTTFFGGGDFEAAFGIPDGFPNFFGTSAAAPHAAGVAALVLQKAGGSGSVSPAKMHDALIKSAPPRDTSFFFVKGDMSGGGAHAQLTAHGQQLASVGLSPNFFALNFSSSNPGQTLDSITIDLGPTGLSFIPGSFPVTQGNSSGGVNITSFSPGTTSTAITITFSGFTSGKTVRFGVDRDFTVAGSPIEQGGSSADHTNGALLTVTLSGGQTLSGTLSSRFTKGYTPLDGFGIIDAVNALSQVRPKD